MVFGINSEEIIVDLGCGNRKRTKGGKLVSEITKYDYSKILSLQLGKEISEDELDQVWEDFPLRKVIGIDCKKTPQTDIICNLGYEKIPLEDNSVDYVLAHDFLEHLPFVDGNRKPIAYLFNEVYRILKNGGYFEIKVPVFPQKVKDNWHKMYPPQHKSYWGSETINKFASKFLLCSKYTCSDGKIHILLLKYEDE